VKNWFLLAAAHILILNAVHAADVDGGTIQNTSDAQQRCSDVCIGKSMLWKETWTIVPPNKLLCRCETNASATDKLRAMFTQNVASGTVLPFESVKKLIEAGADVNTPLYQRGYLKNGGVGPRTTLLHEYARTGNLEAVKFLMARGADVNTTDSSKKTPLNYAEQSKNQDIMNLLTKKTP
jgi:hypothetical protein